MANAQLNMVGIAAQMQALASIMQTMTVQPDNTATPPTTPPQPLIIAARVGVLETAILGLQAQVGQMQAAIDNMQASITALNEDLICRKAE